MDAVLLDANLEPTAIYEARRAEIELALSAPGSKARNERDALSVNKFKSIGIKVWPAGQPNRRESYAQLGESFCYRCFL